MRLVIQRVTKGRVLVQEQTVGEIGPGLLVLVGFGGEDDVNLPGSPVWKKLFDKLMNLRIFTDEEGRFNLSLNDLGADLLLVSQFTLYADCKKGRRPSFSHACEPKLAETLFSQFAKDAHKLAPGKVACGVFGAEMFLEFTNWGPVTITLDSRDL